MEEKTRLPRESEFAVRLDDFAESSGPNLSFQLLKGLRAGVEKGMSHDKIMERTDVVLGMREARMVHTEKQLQLRIDYVLKVISADIDNEESLEELKQRVMIRMRELNTATAKRLAAQMCYRDAKQRHNKKKEKSDERQSEGIV